MALFHPIDTPFMLGSQWLRREQGRDEIESN